MTERISAIQLLQRHYTAMAVDFDRDREKNFEIAQAFRAKQEARTTRTYKKRKASAMGGGDDGGMEGDSGKEPGPGPGSGPGLEGVGIVERIGMRSHDNAQGPGLGPDLGEVLGQVFVRGGSVPMSCDENDMEGGGDDEDNERGGEEGEGGEEKEGQEREGQEREGQEGQGQASGSGSGQGSGQPGFYFGPAQGGPSGLSQRNYPRRSARHLNDIKKTTAPDPKALTYYHKVSIVLTG